MKADAQLETDRLLIRHWTLENSDCEFFHYLNSDPEVMQFFPFRWTRKQSGEMLEKLVRSISDDGLGWAVACLKETGRPIGFTGLSPVRFKTRFTPATEIGWRFDRTFWGKGYATEAAAALLRHGFNDLRLSEIVSFAVPQNTASIAVMKRIGMRPEPSCDFDHPKVPEQFPELKRHVFFKLTRQEWSQNKQGRR